MANKQHTKRLDDITQAVNPTKQIFVVVDGEDVAMDGQHMTLAEWEAVRESITDPLTEVIIFDVVYTQSNPVD